MTEEGREASRVHLRQMIAEGKMTYELWMSLPRIEQLAVRDNSGLTETLTGLEGHRVEVIRKDGTKDRFIVGRSTGWHPCHLEIRTKRSSGGLPADKEYQAVRVVEHDARVARGTL